MSEQKRIAIIGGGYTGLTIAYRLSKLGYAVTIFEKENEIGGLAVDFELDGLQLEKIWHFLYITDSEILNLAKELGVRDELVFHNSSVSTYYGGKLYSFMSPLDLLRFSPISIIDRIRTGFVGLYLQRLNNWKPLTEVTAYEWMKKNAGKRATEVIWEPLLKGKFGEYYDKVIMSWLWGRIKVRVDSKGEEGEKLGYFNGGFRILTDKLVEEIKKNGGEIFTNAAVKRINEEENGSILELENGALIDFDSIVATVPTHVFSKFIKHNKSVTEEKIEKLNSIDYVGASVMVFTSDQEISSYYWHNVNDPEIPFLVFLANSILAGKDTYNGKNVYYIGHYAQHDHEYFEKNEDEIMQEWENGLKKMFPDFDKDKIREKKLFKFKYAQHIVDKGFEEKIPPYKGLLNNVYLSNFSQIYPDDRGLNYAIEEGNKVAEMINNDLMNK